MSSAQITTFFLLSISQSELLAFLSALLSHCASARKIQELSIGASDCLNYFTLQFSIFFDQLNHISTQILILTIQHLNNSIIPIQHKMILIGISLHLS